DRRGEKGGDRLARIGRGQRPPRAVEKAHGIALECQQEQPLLAAVGVVEAAALDAGRAREIDHRRRRETFAPEQIQRLAEDHVLVELPRADHAAHSRSLLTRSSILTKVSNLETERPWRRRTAAGAGCRRP